LAISSCGVVELYRWHKEAAVQQDALQSSITMNWLFGRLSSRHTFTVKVENCLNGWHSTQNTSFHRHSSKATSWLGTEEAKSKTMKANNTRTNILIYLQKRTKNLNLNQQSSVKTAGLCAYHCAQLSLHNITQKGLIIFILLILWTVIIAQMLFTGWEGDQVVNISAP